jgi:hypothetical protein
VDPDTLRIAQTATILVMTVASFVGIGLMTKFLLRLMARPPVVPPQADDDRLSRIEAAVDAIAVDVERIAEAQRFTSKVLAERLPERVPERLPEAAPRAPFRVITPH